MNFQSGRLYIKGVGGQYRDLVYPTTEVPENYQSFYGMIIALITEGPTTPVQIFITERHHEGDQAEGGVVSFHPATDEALREIIAKLSPPHLLNWFSSLERYHWELHPDELARLKRIAMEFTNSAEPD